MTLGRQVGTGEGVPYVDLNGGAVAELLLDHLQEQGARRPALITGDGDRHSYVDVREAFTQATAERGWPVLSATAPESSGEQAGYQACSELLRDHPDIDAVCAMVDTFAVGAVRAVVESGRSVPDDVLVVTRYDGIRAKTCDPSLTAMDLHLDEAATGAVELLLEHLAGGSSRTVFRTPTPTVLARASSLRVTARP